MYKTGKGCRFSGKEDSKSIKGEKNGLRFHGKCLNAKKIQDKQKCYREMHCNDVQSHHVDVRHDASGQDTW